MTDAEIRAYLEDNGYPRHVVAAGRAGLIRRWRQFVEEVERGYRFGLEDYRNDLDVRGILALLSLDQEVADYDARLEPLLTERDRRVWESAPGDPFWDFGYPRNASADLLRDLKSAGLVD
jgi:hypothetical protein